MINFTSNALVDGKIITSNPEESKSSLDLQPVDELIVLKPSKISNGDEFILSSLDDSVISQPNKLPEMSKKQKFFSNVERYNQKRLDEDLKISKFLIGVDLVLLALLGGVKVVQKLIRK